MAFIKSMPFCGFRVDTFFAKTKCVQTNLSQCPSAKTGLDILLKISYCYYKLNSQAKKFILDNVSPVFTNTYRFNFFARR